MGQTVAVGAEVKEVVTPGQETHRLALTKRLKDLLHKRIYRLAQWTTRKKEALKLYVRKR